MKRKRRLDDNPYCVRCRRRMKRAGREKGRGCFRCGGCGARAIYGPRRRLVTPPRHFASCVHCHRALVLAGGGREYLRCPSCGFLVRFEGRVKTYAPQRHLASCVGCRGRMTQTGRGPGRGFYCTRCRWAAQATYSHRPPVTDRQLAAYVGAFVSRDLPREIREEVCLEILLAILKTRRAKNGYGLTPARLTREVVRRFVQEAWRRRHYQHKQISIHDGEFPLSERLAG